MLFSECIISHFRFSMFTSLVIPFCISLIFIGCIHRSPVRVPLVNRRVVTNLGGRSVDMKLSPYDQNFFYASQVRNCFGSSFQVGPFRFNDRNARVISEIVPMARLAVGPRSPLVSRFRSVDIVGDELVIGDRHGSIFRASCVPGTNVRIPINYSTHASFAGSVRVGAAQQDSPQIMISETHGAAIEVPYSIWQELDEALEPKTDDSSFVLCDDQSMDRFPTIDVMIESTGATIRLYPQDYLKKFAWRCRLVVRPGPFRNIILNPLEVPNTNVRVTRDGFEICDRN